MGVRVGLSQKGQREGQDAAVHRLHQRPPALAARLTGRAVEGTDKTKQKLDFLPS